MDAGRGPLRSPVEGFLAVALAPSPLRIFTHTYTWFHSAVFTHTRLVCNHRGGTTGKDTRHICSYRQPYSRRLPMARHAWRSATNRRASHLSDRWKVRCMVRLLCDLPSTSHSKRLEWLSSASD